MKGKTIRIIVLSLMLVLCIIFFIKTIPEPSQKIQNAKLLEKVNKAKYEQIEKNLKKVAVLKDIKINEPESYNYKTKKEIYDIRKRYVKNSLFYTDGYIPSRNVFGQIEDGKPWYGLKYYNCANNVIGSEAVTYGDSEESRFVNNPDSLIGIVGWVRTVEGDYSTNPICKDLSYSNILKKLRYKADSKTLVATYEIPEGNYFNLTGINARDFGYEYIFAEEVENIDFLEKANITNGVYKLQDFIHAGGSCGLMGGCNNASPSQPYLDFEIKNNTKGKIKLKLWRKQPKTPFDKPDINYTIVIYSGVS